MKKKVCLAMSLLMLAGTVPAQAETIGEAEQITFTAKVGTKELYRNQSRISLDAAIYIKDGYAMLPLRAFLTSIDNGTMHWEKETKLAWMMLRGNTVACDIEKNSITVNGEPLEVSGRMDIRDGRIFVPLRNWKNILNGCGYTVADTDIIWDAEEKTATVQLLDDSKVIEIPADAPRMTGEGRKASYTMPLRSEYDEIENIGDGYFIATKFPEAAGIGLSMLGKAYYLLDSKGKRLLSYENGEIEYLKYLGEGYLRLEYENGETALIDRNGKEQFRTAEYSIYQVSEGRVRVSNRGKMGFWDLQGNEIAPFLYDTVWIFSEGMAEVAIYEEIGGKPVPRYGFIDRDGNEVVSPKYIESRDFHDGVAAVQTADGWGYIDKTGKETLVPQYAWAGDFMDGKAFVTEQNGKTWLIDKSGKKVQFITEGLPVIQARENSSAVIQVPLADWGYGDDMTGCPYYNQKGEKLNLTEIALLDAVDGIAVAYDWVTHKRFYIDESGKQCIADTFDGVDAFLDGYAVVQKAITGADGKKDVEWGIIKR